MFTATIERADGSRYSYEVFSDTMLEAIAYKNEHLQPGERMISMLDPDGGGISLEE